MECHVEVLHIEYHQMLSLLHVFTPNKFDRINSETSLFFSENCSLFDVSSLCFSFNLYLLYL